MSKELLSFRLDKETNNMIGKKIGKLITANGAIITKGDYLTDLIAKEYGMSLDVNETKKTNRTTVLVPGDVRNMINNEAKKKNITVSKLIRELVNNS